MTSTTNLRAYCSQPHPGSDAEADRWCEMYHRPVGPAYIRHEGAVLELLELLDNDTAPDVAYAVTATAHGMTTERLQQITRMWCAIAGVPAPERTS